MSDHDLGRTLVLLRHAKSDWSGNGRDDQRPLAKRGRRQAPEAGRWLAANVDAIDLAVVSPAARARSTWDLASTELREVPETRVDDRVYAASAHELLDVVRGLPDDCDTIALVGHNPGMEELVQLLTGEWVEMVTSAIAVISLPGSWSDAGDQCATLGASGRPPR
jgi:phosphohistidine phosphatase